MLGADRAVIVIKGQGWHVHRGCNREESLYRNNNCTSIADLCARCRRGDCRDGVCEWMGHVGS